MNHSVLARKEKMSFKATATLFYGTVFSLLELENYFGLEIGADNFERIDEELEILGFERICRSCNFDDKEIIVSAKTIQVDAYDGIRQLKLDKDLRFDITISQKFMDFVLSTKLQKNVDWFLCAGDL